MLIEVLPFLRGISGDLQTTLGPDSAQLVPTVLAAYAMTSVVIGAGFIVLGLFRLGWIVYRGRPEVNGCVQIQKLPGCILSAYSTYRRYR